MKPVPYDTGDYHHRYTTYKNTPYLQQKMPHATHTVYNTPTTQFAHNKKQEHTILPPQIQIQVLTPLSIITQTKKKN